MLGQHRPRPLPPSEATAIPTALPALQAPTTTPGPPRLVRALPVPGVLLLARATAAQHQRAGQDPPAHRPRGRLQALRTTQRLDARLAPHADTHPHHGPRDTRHLDIAAGAPDRVLAQAEAVDRPGPGAAHQAQFDQTAGLTRTRHRPAEADHRPVEHSALIQPRPRVQERIPDPQVRDPPLPATGRAVGIVQPTAPVRTTRSTGPEIDNDPAPGASCARCGPRAIRRGRGRRAPRVREARALLSPRARTLIKRTRQIGDRRPLPHRDQRILAHLRARPGAHNSEQQIH